MNGMIAQDTKLSHQYKYRIIYSLLSIVLIIIANFILLITLSVTIGKGEGFGGGFAAIFAFSLLFFPITSIIFLILFFMGSKKDLQEKNKLLIMEGNTVEPQNDSFVELSSVLLGIFLGYFIVFPYKAEGTLRGPLSSFLLSEIGFLTMPFYTILTVLTLWTAGKILDAQQRKQKINQKDIYISIVLLVLLLF